LVKPDHLPACGDVIEFAGKRERLEPFPWWQLSCLDHVDNPFSARWIVGGGVAPCQCNGRGGEQYGEDS